MAFLQPGSRFRMTDTLGVPGVVHYGKRSRVEDEWHPNLRGPIAVKVYREMRDNDAIIGGAANIIEQMLSQVKWRVEAASATPRALEAKLLVEQSLSDMDGTFSEFISDVLSMLWFGWSSFEKVYKVRNGSNSKFDDNRIGFKGLFLRSQETLQEWQWDPKVENDEVIGWWQQAWSIQNQPVFLPMAKMVHFRTTSNRGNPEGRSMLRNAYRSWFFLKRMQEIEGVGFERNLEGIPVIRLPQIFWESKKSERAVFDRMVQLIRRNEHQGLTFPAKFNSEGKETGYDIELLTAAGASAVMGAIREAIKGYQREIAINFNTQFQQLGTNGGSHALSSDQTSMFAVGLGSILMRIKETLNNDPINELQELNGFAPEDRAHMEHSDLEKPDVEKFAKAMVSLAQADLLRPDDGVRAKVRDLLDLSQETEDGPDDDEDEQDDAASVVADELVGDEQDEGEEISAQKKRPQVPDDVRETAKKFLETWQSMSKSKRTKSAVMLARAKMLARGRISQSSLDGVRRYFKASSPPTTGSGTAWQYWEANGGDAACKWLKG